MADSETATSTPTESVSRLPERLGVLNGPLFNALDRSGVALIVTGPLDDDCRVVFANAASAMLTGYPQDEIIGRNCRFLQWPDTDPAARAEIRDALKSGRDFTIDLINRRKDGMPFWNRMHVTPIPGDDGASSFYLATLADVSHERAAQTGRGEIDPNHRRLADTRERLRVVQAVAGAAGAWEWQVAERRLIVDARFAGLYGIDPVEAASGLPTSAFFGPIHSDDLLRVKIAVAGVLQGAEVFAKDYRVVAADGSTLWVSARGRMHLDQDDKPSRFTGILSDITEQRRIEDRLNVAQTAGGVGTFEYFTGFATVQVSGQFCALMGLRTTDALPVATINSLVDPEDRPLIGGFDDQAIGPSFRECRVTRADTREARWMARRGENRRDESGSVRFVGVIYDITEAKRAEARLRELADTLEERVRQRTQERDRVWNLSRDLVSVSDVEGIYRALNPAWHTVLGYDDADLLETPAAALIHPDDLAAAMEQFTALKAMTPSKNFDCRLRHKDGTWRWINWTSIPEGELFYSIGRDITQRKHLEDLLRHSQKMEAIGQLTGGLAHDFNNMLTGIMGSLDIMRRRIATGRTQDLNYLLDMALASADRAAALTHRLLAFSRRQSLDNRSVDANALILTMEDLLRRTLGERVAIELALKPDAWTVIADGNQLENAILNLAINARDAMPEGGRLTVATDNVTIGEAEATRLDLTPGDYLRIAIGDTGSGMPKEVISRVFEPFFTTKPIGQGTGLGLSMVYGFAQQSRGHVDITSETGSGTVVTLHLPRLLGEPVAPEVEVPVEAPRGAGETILVVEDDSAVRQLIIEVLNELGYAAVEAADGQSAIPILASGQRLDLMISDVGLPGINGRQLVDIARQHRPGLRILFVTGYAAEAKDRQKFLGPGMDLIFKPFAMDAIATRIREIIQGRS